MQISNKLGTFGAFSVLIISLVGLAWSETESSYPEVVTNSSDLSYKNAIDNEEQVQALWSVGGKVREALQHTDVIEFVDDNYTFPQGDHLGGWAQAHWDKSHRCTKTKITLVYGNSDILFHELGHIYEFCVLRRDYKKE